MPPTEPRGMAVDRLRRAADKARVRGMRVNVSGSDLAVLLDEYDSARLRASDNTAPPAKRSRRRNAPASPDDGACATIIAAADDIMRDHPSLWGQPLGTALETWLADDDTRTLPDGWEQVVTPD